MLTTVGMFVLLTGGSGALAQDAYSDGLAESYQLETAGRFADAVEILAPLIESYPQDFQLVLRLGWLHFKAGEYAEAVEIYQAALDLNPGSSEARLGRGWAHYYLGEKDASYADFTAVLTLEPDSNSAKQGVRLAEPASHLRPALMATYHGYSGHPMKRWALGSSISFPALVRDKLVLSGAYRYTWFATRDGNGLQSAWDDETGFSQHEAHVALGYVRPLWGLAVQYALAYDDIGYSDTAHVVGLSGRVSPLGDILVSTNVSFYGDITVFRGATGWAYSPVKWFSVHPGIAYQWADGENLVTGYLSLKFMTGPVTWLLGGKYGDEVRPAYLEQNVVYSTADRLLYGAHGGLSVALGKEVYLHALYEYVRLETQGQADAMNANLHLGTLGVSFQL